jgi:hypothetical protein
MKVSGKLTAYNVMVAQKVYLYICKNLHEVMYQKIAVSRDKLSKTFLLFSDLQFTALTVKDHPLSRTSLFTSLFFIYMILCCVIGLQIIHI